MLYNHSLKTQKILYEIIKTEKVDLDIIACGGIDSREKLEERKKYGAKEFQIYTAIIYKGLGIVRKLSG